MTEAHTPTSQPLPDVIVKLAGDSAPLRVVWCDHLDARRIGGRQLHCRAENLHI